jgi:hypothetical protein
MENDPMKRLNTALVLGVGLLLTTPTLSSGQIFRKRPEVPAQEEESFGKEAERARLDRIKDELDREGRELDREARWTNQRLEELNRAIDANSQRRWSLLKAQSSWRCPYGMKFWYCGCGAAARIAPLYQRCWDDLERELKPLQIEQENLLRKQDDRLYRIRLYSAKWNRYQEDVAEFRRRYADKKRPLFEEFPKPRLGAPDEKRLEFEDSPKPKRRSLFNP